MRRREFIAGLGSAMAWPVVARAQQVAVPVVGWLDPTSPEARRDFVAAFHLGLADAGYVEGRNVAVERRWAEGRNDRLGALAADLVWRQAAVIVAAGSTPAALAAKAVTSTIPIVFMIGADPVEVGLVASLNRPGGNLTGVSFLNVEVAVKRLELMRELVPNTTSIALLVDPTDRLSGAETTQVETAARILDVRLLVVNGNSQSSIEAAFAVVQQRAGALLVGANARFVAARDQIVALAAHHAIPTIYAVREFVSAGGLVSYGGNVPDAWRKAGVYTGRILRGEKAAELPVQQSTRVDLALNSKTAKSLGITFPTALLVRADEVIE
jgi:putative tryptophan/tyrosine transport system substrate-binding protein